LERVQELIQEKRRVATEYDRVLAGIPGLQRPIQMPWAVNVFWMYSVLIEKPFPLSRDELAIALAQAGIETRPSFTR